MANSIVHFEIPSEDRERSKAFYGGLFGWAFEDVDGMEYTLVNTGGLNGGFIKKAQDTPGLLNYVDVGDVQAFVHRAEKLGATIVRSRAPIPSVGWFAIIKDPDGNTFGLWQDDPSAGF